MIIRKILYILIFISLTSCGYQPIYLKKDNSDFLINKIEVAGNKEINRKIISLLGLKENKDQKNSYNVTITSNKSIETIAKDKSGNPTVYKMILNVQFNIKNPNNQNDIIRSKDFDVDFVYNNKKNKFDLSQYQKNIEDNLINKITEEIIIFINI